MSGGILASREHQLPGMLWRRQVPGRGHAQGLSVSCASSLAWVSSWLEDGLEITAIQMTDVGHEAYLINTVDDMGG